jgi:citrate lyase gamma subunit
MNITRPLALAIMLFFALPALHAQIKSPDTMVHRIFASLKAKDQQAFVQLYPNAQQFGRFIRNIMEQTMKSEEIRKLMEADEKTKGINLDSLIETQVAAVSGPEAMAQMQQEFGKVFQNIIEKGEKKGVNWSEAKLTGFTIDTAAVGAEGAPFQPKGIKEAKGVIDFTVGDVPYQLAFNKMMFIESEGGWFGADFPQIARKGESLQPDPESGENDAEDVAEQMKKEPGAKGKAPATKKNNAKKAPARKKT